MAEWKTVAKTGDFRDGEMHAFDVNAERVAIARSGGTWYAFGDVCTHRQCSLAEGDIEGTTVTCPCHGSQFDAATGAVLAPPANVPVRSYPVRIQGEDVQIEV